MSFWKLTEEKVNGISDRPDSFDTFGDIKSIRSLVQDLVDLVDEENQSDAENIVSFIDSLLSDCGVCSAGFEEWGEGWKDRADMFESKVLDSLDGTGIGYSKTLRGHELVNCWLCGYGNLNFRSLVETYFNNDDFDVMGILPYHTKGDLNIYAEGNISYKEVKTMINFNYLTIGKEEVRVKVTDYFKDWLKPTKEESEYFEMVTGYHYWIRDLFVQNGGK